MGRVAFNISMSLDGFVAGPNPSTEEPLGEGGEALHEWAVGLATFQERHGRSGGETGPDDDVLAEMFDGVGAVVMGRNMFGGEGPWGDDPWRGWWGDDPPYHTPVFVVTHHARETLEMKGGTSFTFVTDGVESAVAQAKAAAGEMDVSLAGGADVIQQCLRAGLVDEGQISVAPILLGGGTSLFGELGSDAPTVEKTRVIDSPGVTHLRFRVVK
jgi:dihydrofolate reductase